MASEKVLTLTESDFDSTLKASPVPVLVDFWAEWCAPCRRLAPTIDAVAAELEGKMAVGKLNVDDHPGVSARFGIRGIPTLILFKEGKPVDQIVGLVSKDELKKMVSAHILRAGTRGSGFGTRGGRPPPRCTHHSDRRPVARREALTWKPNATSSLSDRARQG